MVAKISNLFEQEIKHNLKIMLLVLDFGLIYKSLENKSELCFWSLVFWAQG